MSKLAFFLFVLVSSSSVFASLVVNQPTNGTTLSNPVRIVASDPQATMFRVYVDNVSKYAHSGTSIDTSISVSAGWRNIVVQTWDRYGNIEKYAVSVNARASTYAKRISNLEENFFGSCGTCGNHPGDDRYVKGLPDDRLHEGPEREVFQVLHRWRQPLYKLLLVPQGRLGREGVPHQG
jgi:hypothetical protein